jgi:hypothetical protein
MCNSPGVQCPGDPTTCDGNVFYDSMQCTAAGNDWRWTVLAETVCGDGGPPPQDVSVPEVGIGAE